MLRHWPGYLKGGEGEGRGGGGGGGGEGEGEGEGGGRGGRERGERGTLLSFILYAEIKIFSDPSSLSPLSSCSPWLMHPLLIPLFFSICTLDL